MAEIFPSLQRTYLVLYNWTLFLGGSQVPNIAATALITTSHRSVYAAVENPLLLAQSATLSEILHSLTGIVRSPVASTLSELVDCGDYPLLGLLVQGGIRTRATRAGMAKVQHVSDVVPSGDW
ncbi:Very-long-chain (3R)-3-hydroxyacyl-CoA dehydratase PASTICCINO 2 [Striga hermonthica]|uniref:very-long-chain (3R)-3-hydroxyacyl-CoA dehydratase n=1 Tax=Striga hermonthica TaxID=68872 RepID=A0A9N7R897_STRHE|nr:Very-long-chain (3R)-3-hydroxyacyl-CoA dehydratase PASTICCINO 2 [Striga hermonthica]